MGTASVNGAAPTPPRPAIVGLRTLLYKEIGSGAEQSRYVSSGVNVRLVEIFAL